MKNTTLYTLLCTTIMIPTISLASQDDPKTPARSAIPGHLQTQITDSPLLTPLKTETPKREAEAAIQDAKTKAHSKDDVKKRLDDDLKINTGVDTPVRERIVEAKLPLALRMEEEKMEDLIRAINQKMNIEIQRRTLSYEERKLARELAKQQKKLDAQSQQSLQQNQKELQHKDEQLVQKDNELFAVRKQLATVQGQKEEIEAQLAKLLKEKELIQEQVVKLEADYTREKNDLLTKLRKNELTAERMEQLVKETTDTYIEKSLKLREVQDENDRLILELQKKDSEIKREQMKANTVSTAPLPSAIADKITKAEVNASASTSSLSISSTAADLDNATSTPASTSVTAAAPASEKAPVANAGGVTETPAKESTTTAPKKERAKVGINK